MFWHVYFNQPADVAMVFVSQPGDKTNPNPFSPMSQRTRRRRKRIDEIVYGVMWSREGIRWCLFKLCEILSVRNF